MLRVGQGSGLSPLGKGECSFMWDGNITSGRFLDIACLENRMRVAMEQLRGGMEWAAIGLAYSSAIPSS